MRFDGVDLGWAQRLARQGHPRAQDRSVTDVSAASARIDEVLRPVDITTSDVRALLEDLTDGGDLHLVGSLAAGLGNRGSDVDIQIFVDSDDFTSTPMMFFVKRVVVDVQYFKAGAPASLVPRDCGTADIAGGPCALGAPPSRSKAKSLSRWATALPLDDGVPPLLSDSELATVRAVVTRAGLEEALRLAAMAAILEASAARTASIAWRRAGRALLELAVRTRGDLFIGDKWTWAKARRSDVGEDLVEACSGMAVRREWAEASRLLGLAIPDPREVVVVERPLAPSVTVSGVTYELVDGRTLVPTSPGQDATTEAEPAHRWRTAASRVVVDADAVDTVLQEAR